MWSHCYVCEMLSEVMSLICSKTFEFTSLASIEIEHDKERTFSNLFHKVQLHLSDPSNDIPLIVKRPRSHELLPEEVQYNERTFYCSIVSYIGEEAEIVPICYTQVRCPLFKQYSFIVMEDLTAQGYRVMNKTLTWENLTFCIRILARFHRCMLDLEEGGHWNYRYFCKVVNKLYIEQNKQKQLERIRWFKDETIIWDEVNFRLTGKVLLKLEKMETDIKNNKKAPYSTIIHGHFVRSKLMFKYEDASNKPCHMKILGWQTAKHGSIVTDLGRILLSNLPSDKSLMTFVNFFRQMFSIYTEIIEEDAVQRANLREEIIDRLMYSYLDSIWEQQDHLLLLEVFEMMGALD